MKKKCKNEKINEKITFNTCFRWVSFRRRNVFQTRWMMPAACCLKRKQLFSQKWELCMKHHFSLYCYYFYFIHYLSSLNVSHWFDTFTPRAMYHTNLILEIYVWKVTLLSSYLLLDYFYYLHVKRRPTKIQILEVDG